MTARLIEQPAARRQLLAAIARFPAGERLHLPRLRDALVRQADIISGIERLIADGALDAATLRPPTIKAAPMPPRRTPPAAKGDLPIGRSLALRMLAEGVKRGKTPNQVSRAAFGNGSQIYMMRASTRPVYRRTLDKALAWLGDAPSTTVEPESPIVSVTDPDCRQQPGSCDAPPQGGKQEAGGEREPPCSVHRGGDAAHAEPPASRYPSGAELAAELDAFISSTGAFKTRVGMAIGNCKNGVEQLRRRVTPKPETMTKVRALIDHPPPSLFPAPKAKPKRDPTKAPVDVEYDTAERQRRQGARFGANIRRSQEKEATALLDAGVDPAAAKSTFQGNLMRQVQRRRDDEARHTDPFESAKLKLQRTRVVHSASVTGGRADRFIVSGCNREVKRQEIIDLAGGTLTVTQINEGVG